MSLPSASSNPDNFRLRRVCRGPGNHETQTSVLSSQPADAPDNFKDHKELKRSRALEQKQLSAPFEHAHPHLLLSRPFLRCSRSLNVNEAPNNKSRAVTVTIYHNFRLQFSKRKASVWDTVCHLSCEVCAQCVNYSRIY